MAPNPAAPVRVSRHASHHKRGRLAQVDAPRRLQLADRIADGAVDVAAAEGVPRAAPERRDAVRRAVRAPGVLAPSAQREPPALRLPSQQVCNVASHLELGLAKRA
eukprot:1145897-Prymnesium_polylepis.1